MKTCKKVVLLIFSIVWMMAIAGKDSANYGESWEKRANDRQPPQQVMNAIGLKPGMVIGEVGAGRGRYTVHLARRVGEKGKVFANDIDAGALTYLDERLKRNHIGNVETILGREDDPLFPKGSLDMVIMVWVFHHLDQPVALLKNLIPSLKPGAPVVILDPDPEREGELDSKRPSSRKSLEKEAGAAGFKLVRMETFLPRDLIFILSLPAAGNFQDRR
ncbi:MAG: methyltransferase domain-containing protein [Chrysiogenales bacterium]|nr:MAG: methyltransferase domain-containing protein [Chrysiogenales bacterium]